MMASSLALRLIKIVASGQGLAIRKVMALKLATDHCPRALVSLSPIVPPRSLLRHDRIESYMLAHRNLAEHFILPHLDGLQPHHFKQRQEHADQRLPRFHAHQKLLKPDGPRFEREPPPQVVNHL